MKITKTSIVKFLKELGLLLAIVFVFNSFVLASFQVPTGSMENTVMAGDFLLVNKFTVGGRTLELIPYLGIRLPAFRFPGLRDVRRGDVIVFEFPGLRDEAKPKDFTYYLKRCMALPGDTVQIINKVVYVNGKRAPLPKSFKFLRPNPLPSGLPDPEIFPVGAPFNPDNYGPLRIPKKGDTIDISSEHLKQWKTFIEREGHTVANDRGKVLIDGVPQTRYVVQRDYLFGMGDNRDDSLDSRFWGFVPRENVIGIPLIVYWSWDPNVPIYQLFEKLSSIKWSRIGRLMD